jgi:hypothetical protein
MLLDILSPCLIPRTTFTDNGITVNVRPQKGESVKFFVIDEKSNPKSTLRKALGMHGRICDLVVYYLKEGNRGDALCFVELKGKKIDDALEQILETFEALEGCSESSGHTKWKAYILIGIASPIKLDPGSIKILRAKFGDKDIGWRITKKNDKDDLGSFLRGT